MTITKPKLIVSFIMASLLMTFLAIGCNNETPKDEAPVKPADTPTTKALDTATTRPVKTTN